MKKEELDFIIETNGYLKGGTKEACVKVREVLSSYTNPGNQLTPLLTTTNIPEFVEAVKVLLAFSFYQPDTVPEMWKCDSDCTYSSNLLCKGECAVSDKATKLCPYYFEEDK